jgi:hypothetical protein
MQVGKMNICFDPELGDAVRAAAAATGDWEDEHGVLTAAEIAKAEQELAVGLSFEAVR